MKITNHVPLIVHIPPPLLFVLTFFAGLGLQHLIPIFIHSSKVHETSRSIGVGLLIGGGLIALSCVGMFLFARTTLIPFGKASNLITRGPYRFTRNPMYLSLTLVYLGAVGMTVQPWPLFLLPVPLAILNVFVIPFEEARLREVFGDVFQDYCARVRRWI